MLKCVTIDDKTLFVHLLVISVFVSYPLFKTIFNPYSSYRFYGYIGESFETLGSNRGTYDCFSFVCE
jgi:hypothetical protein